MLEGGWYPTEMEKDCFIMHGATEVARDRLFIQSDRFATHICRVCGNLAIRTPNGTKTCRVCNIENTSIASIQIPYTTKLLFQYLMSIGILPRMLVDKKKNDC